MSCHFLELHSFMSRAGIECRFTTLYVKQAEFWLVDLLHKLLCSFGREGSGPYEVTALSLYEGPRPHGLAILPWSSLPGFYGDPPSPDLLPTILIKWLSRHMAVSMNRCLHYKSSTIWGLY